MVRTCTLCGEDKEGVTALEVVPATWNSFNSYAEVCPTCQESRRFKIWAKAVAAKARVRASDAAQAPPEPAAAAQALQEVQISHRTTGALLHTVQGATLAGANLSGAALPHADLQHAALRGADLHRANLHLADLRGADLRGADLRAVNFQGADLRGTDLRESRLNRADLNHCLYDTKTHWPQGFDPGMWGAVKGPRHG